MSPVDRITEMTAYFKTHKSLENTSETASLVFLAEEIKENRILTTDFRDFTVYLWDNSKEFNILLSK